eukprot:7934473-Karenia_brevis.AAC.1
MASAVRRGNAVRHATAHATSAIFMTRHPGLKAAGVAFRDFAKAHMDRSGLTGAGAKKEDKLGQRVANI